jgi:hypothetical protein
LAPKITEHIINFTTRLISFFILSACPFARHFFYYLYPMQALRLARPRAPLRRSLIVRSLATTANPTHAHVATASSAPSATSTKSQQSIIPLSNVEAQWEKLSQEEQITVHSQLEALQKKDWKTLSIDEKKAGEFFFFSYSLLLYDVGHVLTSFVRIFHVWSLRREQLTTWHLVLTDLELPSHHPAKTLKYSFQQWASSA